MKKIIVCLNILLISTVCIAYPQTSDPLDTIFPPTQVYGLDPWSFLIEEDMYYEFSVKKIFSLHGGYVINLTTCIDNIIDKLLCRIS